MNKKEITSENENPDLLAKLQKEIDSLKAKKLKLEKKIYEFDQKVFKVNCENLKLKKKIAAMELENEKNSAIWSNIFKDVSEAAQAERSKERTPPVSEKPPSSDQGV